MHYPFDQDERVALQTLKSRSPLEPKTLGGFIPVPGLPVHVWGRPGSLTRKWRSSARHITAKVIPDPLPYTGLNIHLCTQAQKMLVLPSVVTMEQHTLGSDLVKLEKKTALGRFLGCVVIVCGADRLTGSSFHSRLHAAQAIVRLRAGLVVNACPVIAFPLLSFGQSLCVSGLFFSRHCRNMKKTMGKQKHVMRGFCRRRGADVSHHTTLLHSWTLCNIATAMQHTAGREMDG